jgi:hypothetical protein
MGAPAASGSENRTVTSDSKATPLDPGLGEIETTWSGARSVAGGLLPGVVVVVCEPELPVPGPVPVEPRVLAAEQPPATSTTASAAIVIAGIPSERRESRRVVALLSNGSPGRSESCN